MLPMPLPPLLPPCECFMKSAICLAKFVRTHRTFAASSSTTMVLSLPLPEALSAMDAKPFASCARSMSSIEQVSVAR